MHRLALRYRVAWLGVMVAAIVASELLKKIVIVSTATVALQEQLFHKDLPRLAAIVPDLRFDIIKGRGRYVCESRLEGAINEEAQASLLGDEFQDPFSGTQWQAKGVPRDSVQAMRWFKDVVKKLRAGKWDGDIDSLERALQLIASQPAIGARARNVKLEDVRRVHLARIRYYLYYRLTSEPAIEVLAFWHTSRGTSPQL